MALRLIRWILGKVILTLDWAFRPSAMKRSTENQARVNELTKNLSLYQFHACPFCVKVRRQIHRLGLQIELRDAQNNDHYRQELISQGGELQVPCLRIEENGASRWMYESDEINTYLTQRFDSL